MADEFGLHALSARLRCADTLWDVYVLWEALSQASARVLAVRPRDRSYNSASQWYHMICWVSSSLWREIQHKISQLLEALPSNNLPPIPWKHLDAVKRVLKECHYQDEGAFIFSTRSLNVEDVAEAVENWSSPSFEG